MMTIEQLQARLREARVRAGGVGRFTVTFDQEARTSCAVAHWLPRPDKATEDCEVVGIGSLDACLASLESYVGAGARPHRRPGRRRSECRDTRTAVASPPGGGMTVAALQARLCEIHARIGFQGRFSFTIPEEPWAASYVTHWIRPSVIAFEACRPIGTGGVSDCLAALECYAAGGQRPVSRHPGAAPRRGFRRQYRRAAE